MKIRAYLQVHASPCSLFRHMFYPVGERVRAESVLHVSTYVRANAYAQVDQIRRPWNFASCDRPGHCTQRYLLYFSGRAFPAVAGGMSLRLAPRLVLLVPSTKSEELLNQSINLQMNGYSCHQ